MLRQFTLACVLVVGGTAHAVPHVDIVVGPQPPALVKLAADELAGQFQKLFGAEATIVARSPQGSTDSILLGSPQTNPEIPAGTWPKLSEQGIVIRPLEDEGRRTLMVGGGSPVATLWAVYELGHHYGIRYLLREDVYPASPPQLNLSGPNLVLEPGFTSRTWIVHDDSAVGANAWSLADDERLLAQLAKLKFNRLRIALTDELPLVSETTKTPRPVFDGAQFSIAGDAPGRKAFQGAKQFTNPDFVGTHSPATDLAAGKEFVRKLAARAEALGFQVAKRTMGSSPGKVEPIAEAGEALFVLTPDTVGMLPQMPLKQVHARLAEARSQGGSSWGVWCRIVGGMDSCAHYLSRASFDASVTPPAALHDLFDPICGRPDITDRIGLAWRAIEQANAQITTRLPRVAAPRPGALLDRFEGSRSEPIEVKDLIKLYTDGTNELYRAHDNCRADTRRLLYYHCKRGEFAMHFLAGVDALQAAAEARRKGDAAARIEQLEKAVEAFYNALDAQGTIARDPSDRGIVAVGNQYIYRPLAEQLEKLSAETN